jgi:toxin ParE1/3/4
MSRYIVSREAREDLKSICRYITQDSPSAAGRLRQVFFEKFRLLAQGPLLGEARDDLARDLRMFTAGNYVVLYRPTEDGITIVQIVHSAQDLAALWRRGDRT